MSLLTNFQTVQNKVDTANWWASRILEHKPEYTPIEYIQSTGSQYIATGLTISPYITFEFQFQLTSTSNEQGIIGARGNGTNMLRHSLMTYNGLFHFMIGDSGSWNGSVNTNKHTVKLTGSGSSWTINADGTNYSVSQSVGSSTSTPYYIFRNGQQNTSYVKMYYVKFYKSGTLVRDFVPAKDMDGVACMYEKLSKTYYYNQGSGSFTAGPEIN